MNPDAGPAWFEVLASERVHDGFSRVRVDTIRNPDGNVSRREVVERMGAVAVVPVDTDGHVLLLRHYRHPVGSYLLEVPAGLLDVEGEDPQAAARRELLEEVGYEAGELRELTTFVNSGGWSTERTRVFLATGCRPGQRPEGFTAESEEADMEVLRLPASEAIRAARDGVIVDAKTIVGLLLAEPHLDAHR